jgi:hypothetical protein
MLLDGRAAHIESVGNRLHRTRAAAQPLEHTATCGIAKCIQDSFSVHGAHQFIRMSRLSHGVLMVSRDLRKVNTYCWTYGDSGAYEARVRASHQNLTVSGRGHRGLASVRIVTPWTFAQGRFAALQKVRRGASTRIARTCAQLLVHHLTFGPGYTAGCATCSTIADGFAVHLANHDVTLAAVSQGARAA